MLAIVNNTGVLTKPDLLSPNRRLTETHMRSKMEEVICYFMAVAGILAVAFSSEKAFGVGVTCFALISLAIAFDRDRLKMEIEKVSKRRPIRFSLRLKGQGQYDGIWLGELHLDPTTGRLEAPPNQEERLLTRTRYSTWIGGMRDEVVRTPRYVLNSNEMKVYLKGAEYRFDTDAPGFDYAIE